ncbi:MAG: hypothetical protein ACP6IY_22145, partial [Promethearchaeia archaeon]
MSYEFLDQENERFRKIIENELLSNPNPFPRNPVCSRDNLPKFCLGRDEEIGIIKNGIEKVAKSYNHKSAWIPINGSGGTGKTTIALYIYNSAKNKRSRDLDIDYLECAYLDCPSEEKFLNIINIYKRILRDLGKTPGNFPYILGFQFIVQLCTYFEQEYSLKEEFIKRFATSWKIVSRSTSHSDLLMKLKKKAPNFARDLKHFVQEFDFIILNNESLGLPLDYIKILIDLVSDNTHYRKKAYDEIMGETLENEEDAINLLRNLISVLNFLANKTCLLIIIDNLENLPETRDSCKKLFQLLLKFRNTINNCLLLTIGSTDFWEFFNKTLNTSELNMIAGFRFDEITLTNLSEKDASRIMKKYIVDFWKAVSTKGRPKGADSAFPFNLKSFQYLYEINDRNLRDSLKILYNLIEKFKIENQIYYLKNIEDAIYYLRPNTDPVYLFENELAYLENFVETYSDRNQLSRDIEIGLFNAFNEIKKINPYNTLINKVEHEPFIRTKNGKIAKPDILLTLFGSETMENIKKAEIQVKTYYPTNKVNKNEIESSLKLLSEHKIHYLYFLTLSPLSDDAIKALQEYNTQVGRISKLTPEETCYLLLLTRYFSNLFFKKKILTPNLYLQIFEKFGLKLNKLLERIKNIIPIEISTRKKKSEEKKPIKPPPPK